MKMELRNTDFNSGEITVALAGNPNSGKTSVFNQITGGKQHVGNWPGVTVEKKEGYTNFKGESLNVVDLPGTYSLGAYSEDEIVAKDFLLSGKPDVVINIVDATNIERNLYLTLQLLEMGVKVVMALNMFDQVEKQKLVIDLGKLSEALGVPVIKTSATGGRGIKELLTAAVELSGQKEWKIPEVDYGQDVENVLDRISNIVSENSELSRSYDTRWLALKLLEQDEQIVKMAEEYLSGQQIREIENEIEELEGTLGEESDAVIAGRKYGYIHGLTRKAVKRPTTVEERVSLSDKIDRVVTSRLLGLPIFLLVMWGMFKITFTLADPLMVWIEEFFAFLGTVAGSWLTALGASSFLVSLFVDGIIGGVGA
ncbi:MAG: FeoB small GTPase domain-containing protein, partial [Halanaerobiales bacterium]